MNSKAFPHLGFGLGLRTQHYPYIFENTPLVDWFEVISENFIDTDGRPKHNLERIKERYPIVMHGVALSIGTIDPLNSEYLQKLKTAMHWINPAWISDHLCWTGVAHKNTHDLLPVPYTEAALSHVVARIKAVQDYIERPMAFENPSTYLEFKSSSMHEAEFIARMLEASNAYLLLDVNNVYVTCYNHSLDPKAYIDALPLDRVVQIHLSGHTNKGTHIIDTHDDYVVDEVWDIYRYVLQKAKRVPNTMIEWDDQMPDFPVLLAELEKAKEIASSVSNLQLLQNKEAKRAEASSVALTLVEAQNILQNAILQGSAVDTQADQWILDKEKFSAQEQLNVYINAYRYRLFDVVAEDYPVLKTYWGDEKFKQVMTDFVENTPSDHFNIARYSLKLAEFILRLQPQDVFAYELCQLETTISELIDAPEVEALKAQHLEGMTAESLMQTKLYPRGALQLFAFDYAVNAYYQVVMDGETGQLPIAEASYLVVFRHEDVVWRMELEQAEYALLSNLFSGKTVGATLEDVDENLIHQLPEWFSRWVRNGLLAYQPIAEPT